MTARIFVSGPLPGDAVERLRAAFDVKVGEAGEGVRGAVFAACAGEIDALVALLTDRIDAALLARAPRLRVVGNVAVGVDNVDLEACRARGVAVTNTPGVLTEATADVAFGLLLAAARRIAEGDRLIRAGEFPAWSPTTLLGRPVHGASLGVVGMGRIGQAMARRARGFGMHVHYTQRTRLAPELERALGATYADMDALFATCDFVSLHCPLTDATRGLVSRERLARMKPGSILVNTARGACVDEAALADALARGPLAAAGLDVFEDEPRVHPALRAAPNAVLAPHIGSADGPTREAMARMAVENVIALLEGRSAPNRVV
jgi:glyoxylate reductase